MEIKKIKPDIIAGIMLSLASAIVLYWFVRGIVNEVYGFNIYTLGRIAELFGIIALTVAVFIKKGGLFLDIAAAATFANIFRDCMQTVFSIGHHMESVGGMVLLRWFVYYIAMLGMCIGVIILNHSKSEEQRNKLKLIPVIAAGLCFVHTIIIMIMGTTTLTIVYRLAMVVAFAVIPVCGIIREDAGKRVASYTKPQNTYQTREVRTMKFCTNCGNQLPEGAAFCPECGSKSAQSQAGAGTVQTYTGQNSQNYSQNYNQNYNTNYNYNQGYQQVPDIPSTGLNVLSFFFPIVGLILFLVMQDKTPMKAKACGKFALIGFIVSVVLTVLLYGCGAAVLLSY